MRNFFVSDKQIVPAQGAPVLGMLVASWPWPCQKYDQTKKRASGERKKSEVKSPIGVSGLGG